MKTIVKAAGLTAAGCAMIFGGAGAAVADGGSQAEGHAIGSPGVVSGNVIQVPVSVPINICGNSIHILSALNLTADNVCVNQDGAQRSAKGEKGEKKDGKKKDEKKHDKKDGKRDGKKHDKKDHSHHDPRGTHHHS